MDPLPKRGIHLFGIYVELSGARLEKLNAKYK
jgi:hypothetical protein